MSEVLKDVEEVVEENVEEIEESLESTDIETSDVENISDDIEEIAEDVTEAVEENEITEEVAEVAAATVATAAATAKVKKHVEAKQIIEEAKHIVETSEKELSECKLLLENDLRDYQDAKRALNEGGLEDAKALLVELGHATVEELESLEEPELEVKDTVDALYIKDVSSGKFTGFILSLIAGAATVGGMAYFAAKKLGATLDVSKVPNDETINSVTTWYSNAVGMGENGQVGMAVMAAAALLVMFIVYALRVGLKGSSNLNFATQQMEETQKFAEEKHNCKQEMDRVDAHINAAIHTLKDYQVLLNEQNGKLHRMVHFERKEAEVHGYSLASIEDMNETQSLIAGVQSFISQPMLENSKLLDESTEALAEAQERVRTVLSKLV